MDKLVTILKSGFVVLLIAGLAVGLMIVLRSASRIVLSGQGGSSPIQVSQEQAQLPTQRPQVLSTSPIQPSPTPTWTQIPWEDIVPPTPTTPPFPTPLPTPVVTPIPTIAPPVITNVVGVSPQPFWIYYWRDNEVWRVDNQGRDRELLLDTSQSLGQWLTGHPMEGTDCCWNGLRVVVSPDSQKLALVVVDKITITKGETFTFSIYVFDLQTRDLSLVSEGVQPVWSPDGQRIAFLKQGGYGGLWIADLETGQTHNQIPVHQNSNMRIAEFAWSPDGTQIAYLYAYGQFQYMPTIWVVDTIAGTSPNQLLSLNGSYPIYGITWSPDGQQIFFLSQEGGRDPRFYRVQNLWSVSLATGTPVQLTQEMVVQSYGVLPNNQWLFIAGYQLYEQSQANYERDLWLLRTDGGDLRRVTANQGNLAIVGWSPEGTHLVVWRPEADPLLYSLKDRTVSILNFDLGFNYKIGGAK